MSKLEVELRKAFALVNDTSIQGRENVYKSAHRAIMALPEDARPRLEQELFGAITRIEQEFNAREQPKEGEISTGNAELDDVPATAEMDEPASIEFKQRQKKAEGSRFRLSKWGEGLFPSGLGARLIIPGLALLLLLAGLAVFISMNSADPYSEKPEVSIDQSQSTSSLEKVAGLLFQTELGSLTIHGQTADQIKVGNAGGIVIDKDTNLFGPEFVTLDKSSVYLGRVEFQLSGLEEGGELPVLFAGVQNFDASGNALSGPDVFSHFIHTGRLQRGTLSRSETGNYLVSGIVFAGGETRDDSFPQGAEQFKLFAGVAMEGSDAKVELVSMEIFEIGD